MSQSPATSATDQYAHPSSEHVRRVTAETPVQKLLGALDDAGCRAILDATSEDALSANEISETCDLPLSTTYRTLDRLTAVRLLEERTRVRRSGTHASEYVRLIEEVVVALSPQGEIELQVSQRENTKRV